MTRLPAELTDIIIALLSSEQALLSCSLVCKSWLPASRCRLFSTIILENSPKRARALVELLATPSSTIARYVRTVRLLNDEGRPFEPLSTIAQPLEQLVGVERLTVRGYWESVRAWEFECLSMWFAKITTLDLWIWDPVFDFPHLLSLFHSLRVLRLRAANNAEWNTDHTFSFPSGLRVIDIFCWGGEISWLFCFGSPAVSELRLSNVSMEDIPSLQRLFHLWGNSIQSLYMSFGHVGRDHDVMRMLREGLDLSCLSNLQVLRINGRVDQSSSLSDLVSQIASEHMTEIALQLRCDSNEVDKMLTLINWSRLADTLCHPRFVQLYRVKIILDMVDGPRPIKSQADEWVRRVRTELGTLDSRGSLFVSVLDEYTNL